MSQLDRRFALTFTRTCTLKVAESYTHTLDTAHHWGGLRNICIDHPKPLHLHRCRLRRVLPRCHGACCMAVPSLPKPLPIIAT